MQGFGATIHCMCRVTQRLAVRNAWPICVCVCGCVYTKATQLPARRQHTVVSFSLCIAAPSTHLMHAHCLHLGSLLRDSGLEAW